MSSLNIEKSCGPASTRMIRALSCGDARIVLREITAIELGERTGALDPRRPPAHHHDVQRAVVDEVGVPVRVLPLPQDVVLEPHGVRKRVHRKRVLRGPLGAEEVDLRAEREHEVVVGDRRQLRKLHLARVEIDSGHTSPDGPSRSPARGPGRAANGRRRSARAARSRADTGAAGRCDSRACPPARPRRRRP